MLIPKELIIEAKEKLGDQASLIIAKDLQLKEFDEENLKSLCCFHEEKSPSFIWSQKDFAYKCFGCGVRYGIIDHYISFYKLSYLDAVKKLFETTNIKFAFGQKGVKTKKDYIYPYYDCSEDRSKVDEYLGLRKISKETLDWAGVTESKDGNIAFNYYDTNDVLTLVKYRPAKKIDKDKDKNKMWCQKGSGTTPLLYNMNRVDFTNGPLALVEGEIDCLSLIESGFKNSVSIPFGANSMAWIEENYDWLEQFNRIIVVFDNDVAGINGRIEVCSRLGQYRTLFVDIPKTLIGFDGKNHEVKDINEVLFYAGKEKVLNLLDNAEEMPITDVIDLYNVLDFDIETAPGIYSSSDEINEHIYKYLFGTLVIVSGRNGNGKSVFLNQEFIAEPINQGYDVFVYSGEMPRPILKSWIELVLAGRDFVKLKNNVVHTIDDIAKKLMREWYKDRIFIYDNDKENGVDAILGKLELLVRKKGIKVALIDNMTIIDLQTKDETDIWQAQKKFVVRLINFASKYNILIVLVDHPRKTAEYRRLTADDVGGPGAITNLAHYGILIHRYTKKEKLGEKDKRGGYLKGQEPKKHDVVLDLFKNRITGKLNHDIERYFDFLSYRFYETPKELHKRYGWDKRETTPSTIDPNEHETLPDAMKD